MNLEIKIANLKNRLKRVCGEDTCYPTCRDEWTSENPFVGHCAIVTAIVNKKFGGEIIRAVIAESGVSHYWNKIDGKDFDLTREQFNGKVVTFTDFSKSSIDLILNNEDTLKRYNILLERLQKLENEISK